MNNFRALAMRPAALHPLCPVRALQRPLLERTLRKPSKSFLRPVNVGSASRDLVEVSRGPESSSSTPGSSPSSPSPQPPPASPQPARKSSRIVFNPVYVILGAVAAMAAAAVAIWLHGAAAASQAGQGGAAAAGSTLSASAAAAAVVPALASVWKAVASPVAEVLHHMFMGWQHCWVVMTAHPSMSGLQQCSEVARQISAVVPWQIIAAVAAIAATALSIRRQMAKEKAAIRWVVKLMCKSGSALEHMCTLLCASISVHRCRHTASAYGPLLHFEQQHTTAHTSSSRSRSCAYDRVSIALCTWAVIKTLLYACRCIAARQTARSHYQQQLEAAMHVLQAQQQADIADLAQLNAFLQDLGIPPVSPASPAAAAAANGNGRVAASPAPGQGRQQQQQQRAGPMVELRLRLQNLRGALEARARSQRDMQQQLEAQVSAVQ